VKTPPAASIRLGISRWYQTAVALSAILLVAACAIFYGASGVLDIKMLLLAVCATGAIAWAAVDALRPRAGALHYAAGEWVLALGDHESQGTLQVVIDLQQYLLVRFTPLGHGLQVVPAQQLKPQWLHLESRYTQRQGLQQAQAAAQDWRALRRALFAWAVPAERP
jgi:hypothetical protein